jgi:hypothetical protein
MAGHHAPTAEQANRFPLRAAVKLFIINSIMIILPEKTPPTSVTQEYWRAVNRSTGHRDHIGRMKPGFIYSALCHECEHPQTTTFICVPESDVSG